MQIIPIMPIETMFGMVNRRAGYYIRRSPTGKLYSCRCPDRAPTAHATSRHPPKPPISSASPPATPAAINTRRHQYPAATLPPTMTSGPVHQWTSKLSPKKDIHYSLIINH